MVETGSARVAVIGGGWAGCAAAVTLAAAGLPVTLFEQALEFAETNVSHFESATYSALVAELSALDPLAQRSRAIYGELNQLMLDEAWVIPTGVPQVRIDLVGKRVHGWPSTPADYILAITGKVRFGEVWLA